MEYGPRALGARSILAEAKNPEVTKQLNEKLQQGFSVEDAIRKSATDGGNQAT